MFRESPIYITFLLLALVPPVSAAALPPVYIAVVGVILFIVLVAIAARIADRYHLWESLKKVENQYPEDDGRYEMKVFKGFGFGDNDDCPTPVLYEKRKHEKRGLTYQELAHEVDSVADRQRNEAPAPAAKPKVKLTKKEKKEEKERRLREELSRCISKDENVSMTNSYNMDNEPATSSKPPGAVKVLSPRQPRAAMSPKVKRAMSPPPPPPNPRTDIPTSPSQKRAMSPRPRRPENPVPSDPPPRTKTPLSPTRRAKNPLSPKVPQRNPPQPSSYHNTLPAKSSDQSSEPVTTPTGYHYPTLPHPGGYFPPHPGGYPPVPPSPGYPVYPHPAYPPHPGVAAYPAYPPQTAAPLEESGAPVPVPPVPVQAAAYHMPYPYPHPGYYPPHPGYPPAAPGVSQSKHQSQL